MKPIIRPAARDDILRQFRYYLVDQDKPEVAERFLRAVRKTMEQICGRLVPVRPGAFLMRSSVA